jgi:hypothetical protein
MQIDESDQQLTNAKSPIRDSLHRGSKVIAVILTSHLTKCDSEPKAGKGMICFLPSGLPKRTTVMYKTQNQVRWLSLFILFILRESDAEYRSRSRFKVFSANL